jgi:hypothetical protein
MKTKTGLKAGTDNTATINVNVAQNSGAGGSSTAGGPPA